MPKLQFHPEIFEFIEEHSDEKVYAVISQLQNIFDAGVDEINIFHTGEGDSGNETLFNFYKDGRDVVLNLPIGHIEDFVWAAASATTPGYEINDGGGYDVIIKFREDGRVSFDAEGYYNQRSVTYSFGIGEDDEATES